jgi:hypothetical protein
MKFKWMIYISSAIMRQFFLRDLVIFNALFPTLSKVLCTSVVKFPSSTAEHNTKNLFQLTAICKMAARVASLLSQTGGSWRVFTPP